MGGSFQNQLGLKLELVDGQVAILLIAAAHRPMPE